MKNIKRQNDVSETRFFQKPHYCIEMLLLFCLVTAQIVKLDVLKLLKSRLPDQMYFRAAIYWRIPFS